MAITRVAGSLGAGLAAVLLATSPASADAIRGDGGFTSSFLTRNDDLSTGAVNLGFTLNFFGTSRDTVFVNNNGNLTFGTGLSTFTPFGLSSTNTQIIAPFFADVDTRNLSSSVVTFGTSTVDGHNAFGANYLNVGYYSQHVDKLNSFQVVLIERADRGAGDFDIEFNYRQVQWETGDASGGVGGLGGSSARAGYSNGSTTAGTFFELPGSAVNGAFLDGGPNSLVAGSFNSTQQGRYLFEVNNGQATIPGITPNDPFLPNSSTPGGPGEPPLYFFSNVPSGRWFDPPLVSSYRYTGLGGTLFTGVQFPSGFGDNFTLSALGCTFSSPFSGLTLINFASFCSSAGISEFIVSGISPLVDSADSAAFPTQLFFAGGTGSFTMQGITARTPAPEPTSAALALVGAAMAAYRARARRRQATV
jgi:hypothetical protein